MKYCKKCGKLFPDQQLLCPDCRLMLGDWDEKTGGPADQKGPKKKHRRSGFFSGKTDRSGIDEIFDDVNEGIQGSFDAINQGIQSIGDSLSGLKQQSRQGFFGGLFSGVFQKRRFTKAEEIKIRQRRNGEEYLAGIVFFLMLALTGVAGAVVLPLMYLKAGAGCAAAACGAAALAFQRVRKKKLGMWEQYENLISWTGITPLQLLTEATGRDTEAVCLDLQEMISKNFLVGPRGDLVPVIDRQAELLVMNDYQTGLPLESVEEYLRQKQEKEAARARAEQERKAAAARSADPVYIIRMASADAEDPEIKAQLMKVSGSLERIQRRIRENSELENLSFVRRLDTAYIPHTLKLAETCRDSSMSPALVQQVKDSLQICCEAFENLEERLDEAEAFHTKVDLDVMEEMFRRDGLLDSDFDLE